MALFKRKRQNEDAGQPAPQKDRFGTLFLDAEPPMYRTPSFDSAEPSEEIQPSQVPLPPQAEEEPAPPQEEPREEIVEDTLLSLLEHVRTDAPMQKQELPDDIDDIDEFSPFADELKAKKAQHATAAPQEEPSAPTAKGDAKKQPPETEPPAEDLSGLDVPDFLSEVLNPQGGENASAFPSEEEIKQALEGALVSAEEAEKQKEQEKAQAEQINLGQLLQETDPEYNSPAAKRARAREARRAEKEKARAKRAAEKDEKAAQKAAGLAQGKGEEANSASGAKANEKEAKPIRPKRSAEERKKLRRRILAVAVPLACVCLLLFSFLALRAREVIVENMTYYQAADLVETCGIHKNQFLPFLNRSALSETITTKFPYIRKAVISYALPGKIIINTTEDVPGFYTAIHDEYFLISTNLRVLGRFESKEELPEGAKELRTSKISYAVVGYQLKFFEGTYTDYLLQILEALSASELNDSLTLIDAQYRYDIDLYYDDRFEIQIGSATDLASKLQFVQGILADTAEDAKGIIHVNDVKSASVQIQR